MGIRFRKMNNFGLHTPYIMRFTPQSQELEAQEILTEKF